MLLLRYLFILCLVIVALPVNAENGTDPNSILRIAAQKNIPPVRTKTGTQPETSILTESPLPPLTLPDYVRSVVKYNEQLHKQKAELGITRADEEKTYAIFEPELVTGLDYKKNKQKNTVEESVSRLFTRTYSERNWNFDSSIEGLVKTGGEYNLGYNLQRLSTSLTRDLTDEDHEYQMYLGASLKQPLLKNFGPKTTTAAIRSAKLESEISFQEYRQEMMRIVSKASTSYWNHYFAQQKLLLQEESIRIANGILTDNRERVRTGKMAEVEVYEAMAAVASRKSLRSEAEHELVESSNQMRTLLSGEASSQPLDVAAIEPSQILVSSPLKEHLVETAFQLKPRYLAAQNKLKQSGIKLAFAKNQSWPELNLMASYGLNGLGFSGSDAWEDIRKTRYHNWGVGIEYRQPLWGGIEGKSEYKKAALEKKRQLYALKDLEVELINTIDTALHKLQSKTEQLQYAKSLVEIQKKIFDTEMARLKAGKSDSRTLLEKEDIYRNAKEAELRSRVKLRIAQVELELADGSILASNGVEIMEKSF